MPNLYDVTTKSVEPAAVLEPMLGKDVTIVVGPPPCLGDDMDLAWAIGTLLHRATGGYNIAGTRVVIRFTVEMVTKIETGVGQHPVIRVSL